MLHGFENMPLKLHTPNNASTTYATYLVTRQLLIEKPDLSVLPGMITLGLGMRPPFQMELGVPHDTAIHSSSRQ
eukprot:5116971-Amphidinium_carterae.1